MVLRVYLTLIGVVYAFGALSHLSNLIKKGGSSESEWPLHWKLTDVYYLIINVIVAIGLFLGSVFGEFFFLIAATSQFILYVGFPDKFSKNEKQRDALRSLVVFHIITVMLYLVLKLAVFTN